MAAVRFLQHNPACSFRELENALNREHTGLLTPSLGLIRAVLASYANETEGHWDLRPEDNPGERRIDLESAAGSLATLGAKLGYTIQRTEPPRQLVRWLEHKQVIFNFYLLASALVGSILRQVPAQPGLSFLVIPGGRAGLLTYKLERDASLRSSAKQWSILKFRQLRHLAEMNTLTRELLEKELTSDPIEPPEQMKLF